jgi:hypothetical protein
MQKCGLVCGLVIVMLVRLVVNLVGFGGKFKWDKNSKFEKSETNVSCKNSVQIGRRRIPSPPPPSPLSLNFPLHTLAATSVRTLLPPMSPQSPPHQRTKVPILVKKAMMFSLAVAHFLVQGMLLESPTGHLAPRRGRTNQVARERPPAGNEPINQDGYVRRHLPPHNSANRPTHQMRGGGTKSYLLWELVWSKISGKKTEKGLGGWKARGWKNSVIWR